MTIRHSSNAGVGKLNICLIKFPSTFACWNNLLIHSSHVPRSSMVALNNLHQFSHFLFSAEHVYLNVSALLGVFEKNVHMPGFTSYCRHSFLLTIPITLMKLNVRDRDLASCAARSETVDGETLGFDLKSTCAHRPSVLPYLV